MIEPTKCTACGGLFDRAKLNDRRECSSCSERDSEPDVYDELRDWMVSESAESQLFRKELRIENKEIRDILVERNALLKPHPDWETSECIDCGNFWFTASSNQGIEKKLQLRDSGCRICTGDCDPDTGACPKYHPRKKK